MCVTNFKIMALTDQENDWMSAAFDQAKEALIAGEVPVGCVFIHEGEVRARGRNTVNATRNATRHAEMNCIDQILEWCQSNNINYWDVFKCIDVYVTVEPCGMCADILGKLCIRKVVFGCSNDRFGGCGSVIDVPKLYGYSFNITRGVRAEEAIGLLKDFYKGENPNAPTGKAKRKNSR